MITTAYTLHNLVKDAHSSLNVQQVIECLRSLRNACATSSDVQNSLSHETSVLQDVCSAINAVLSMHKSEESIVCLRVGVQFLGNFIVNNVENQKEVWSQCSSLLRSLLLFEDTKLNDYCAMVLYNIVLGNPEIKEEIVSTDCVKAVCCIGMQGSEFALYLMEQLICQEGTLEKIYGPSIPEHRLFILEVIDMTLKSESIKLPASVFHFLSSEFIQTSDKILKTVNTVDIDDIEPEEVVKLLEVFAHASRDERYLVILQDDTSLFVTCAYLLKSMHEIGKSENNCFSAIQKLSTVTSIEPELKQHPAYGFKASLISVLGNLCWKHSKNQDLMRTMECLPVLLDCCNVDARNPFIIQWVVLAIRNICDGNQENQQVIAGMNREGIVTSALLEEMGITLHADEHDNKIRIVPLKQ